MYSLNDNLLAGPTLGPIDPLNAGNQLDGSALVDPETDGAVRPGKVGEGYCVYGGRSYATHAKLTHVDGKVYECGLNGEWMPADSA